MAQKVANQGGIELARGASNGDVVLNPVLTAPPVLIDNPARLDVLTTEIKNSLIFKKM